MHCSLIMYGFHNGKWLILCSNNKLRMVYKVNGNPYVDSRDLEYVLKHP